MNFLPVRVAMVGATLLARSDAVRSPPTPPFSAPTGPDAASVNDSARSPVRLRPIR